MKIVINADDFGISNNVNDSIIYCYQKGCLTSTSLMAKGKAFEAAIRLIKKNPGLGVGVHLALDGPFNVLFQDSALYSNKKEFYDKEYVIDHLKKHKFDTVDIIKEFSRQIEKILEKGIRISHLDHHHHLHLYYQSLKAMIHVAKKYKIKYIRSQKIIMHHKKSIAKKIYRNLHQLYLKLHHNAINGYYDLIYQEYDSEKERLEKLLNSGYSKIEIVAHPEFLNDFTTRFLTDRNIIELFKKHELVNYHEI